MEDGRVVVNELPRHDNTAAYDAMRARAANEVDAGRQGAARKREDMASWGQNAVVQKVNTAAKHVKDGQRHMLQAGDAQHEASLGLEWIGMRGA